MCAVTSPSNLSTGQLDTTRSCLQKYHHLQKVYLKFESVGRLSLWLGQNSCNLISGKLYRHTQGVHSWSSSVSQSNAIDS